MQRTHDLLVRLRILPRDQRPPLGKYLLRHTPIVLAIFVLTLVAEQFGYFRRQENYALDAILNLSNPTLDVPIVLVVIDDLDYAQFFSGTSPLDPKAVFSALEEIQLGKPAVVAVDLDTSHAGYAGKKWPPAVWHRNAVPHEDDSAESLDHRFSARALEEITRGSFLGHDFEEEYPGEHGVITTRPRSGPSLFLGDKDGVIRRYRQIYDSVSDDPEHQLRGFIESFPWAICQAYAEHLHAIGADESKIYRRIEREAHHDTHHLSEEILMSFGGRRDRYPTIRLRDLKTAAAQPYWQQNALVKDAVVLFGGTYAAGRDVYMTPVGPRHGLELVAQAVETSLTMGGIREFNHHLAHILDLVVGYLILIILWRFPGHTAFATTLFAAMGLAYLASFIAFHSLAHWFNFAPMVGGLWLHYQWEKRLELRELHHEIHALRRELNELKNRP